MTKLNKPELQGRAWGFKEEWGMFPQQNWRGNPTIKTPQFKELFSRLLYSIILSKKISRFSKRNTCTFLFPLFRDELFSCLHRYLGTMKFFLKLWRTEGKDLHFLKNIIVRLIKSKKENSLTGTRTRVARVKTWYPNQLDY